MQLGSSLISQTVKFSSAGLTVLQPWFWQKCLATWSIFLISSCLSSQGHKPHDVCASLATDSVRLATYCARLLGRVGVVPGGRWQDGQVRPQLQWAKPERSGIRLLQRAVLRQQSLVLHTLQPERKSKFVVFNSNNLKYPIVDEFQRETQKGFS